MINSRNLIYTNILDLTSKVVPLDEKTDEVVTPFVDDINDQISIYVEHLANGQLRLSDD
ncbi:DUF1828 domain-containing protein [Limosilactobacillus fermentum]